MHPTKFKEVAEATQRVAGFKDGDVGVPSVALKIGFSLSECAGILKSEGIMNEDDDGVRSADRFLELYRREWKVMVSSRALGTLQERKWNAPDKLPIHEDVKRTASVLKNDLEQAKLQLRETPSIQNYVSLARATLATVLLFNRRRPGETERLTIETFGKRSKSVNEEITQHLSQLEQELCRELTHVTIRGKRGIGVPVLLSSALLETLEMLVASRAEVGISPDNPYVFTSGVDATAAPLRGSDCVRVFAKKAGAANISATSYRKHAATMLQLLQLSDTEMDVVARFMGHDIRIHRSYYRLPERTLYAAKVSKILLAMERGMGEFAGQGLNDLSPMDISQEAKPPVQEGMQETSRLDPGAEDEEEDGDSERESGQSCQGVDKAASRVHTLKAQRKPVKRIPWTPDEKAAVSKWMGGFIRDMKCPPMSKCMEVLKKEPRLAKRSWKDLKYCTYNMIQRQKRCVLRMS